MNVDFLTWFFGKHYILAFFLFPEISVAWGVWMKWWWYTGFGVITVLGKNYQSNQIFLMLKRKE